MKLIGEQNIILQEKEYKPKKGEPQQNPAIVGEATVIKSNNKLLKSGDKVMFNRMGILDLPIGKKKYVIVDIEDIFVTL